MPMWRNLSLSLLLIIFVMLRKELVKRYIVFILGVFFISMGIALVIKCDLGNSPISSGPYIWSLYFKPTVGLFAFLLNMTFLLAQVIILKKDFKKIELLQIPISIVFGFFIDFALWILASLELNSYITRFIALSIGCVIMGFGVYLEVVTNVVMLSAESLIRAITIKYKKDFGLTKIVFDITIMLFACFTSLILFSKIVGIREGTVIAAITVGYFSRIFYRNCKKINQLFSDETQDKKKFSNNLIIAISREYGSGGHQIGAKLSKKLNISFYDKELIELAAKESGLSASAVGQKEQNRSSSFLYELIGRDNFPMIKEGLSEDDLLFVSQSKVIRRIANKESCVIMGRCADYILKDFPLVLKVFVHADDNSRIQRIRDEYGVAGDKIDLRKYDKARANYYRHYTDRVWGDAKYYDLTINSSDLGIDESAEIIENLSNSFLQKKKSKKK